MVNLIQDFDGQTDGTAVTSANSGASGDAFNGVTIPGALAMTYSAEQRAHGNRSLKVSNTDTTGATGFAYWNAPTGTTTYYFRGYIYLTGLPNALTPVIQQVIGGTNRNLLAVTSTGQFGFADNAGVQYFTTWTASLNLWYRYEMAVTLGASGSVLFKVFSLDSTTALATLNPTAINMSTGALTQLRFGKGATSPLVASYYFDDLAFSDTAPIGPYSSTPPTVTAGSNVSGMAVTLQSTVTTFDSAAPTYAWTQTSGPTVTLSSTTAANPTFTAPSTNTYGFTVTITDSVGATATATVSTTVTAAVGAPTATLAMYHDIFVIDATASTPATSGALSYAITPSTGLTVLAPGLWAGTMPTTAKPFTVTVTEAGNSTTATASVTVPGAATATGGGIHILRATADASSGGSFL